jgi:hypothetical protein
VITILLLRGLRAQGVRVHVGVRRRRRLWRWWRRRRTWRRGVSATAKVERAHKERAAEGGPQNRLASVHNQTRFLLNERSLQSKRRRRPRVDRATGGAGAMILTPPRQRKFLA